MTILTVLNGHWMVPHEQFHIKDFINRKKKLNEKIHPEKLYKYLKLIHITKKLFDACYDISYSRVAKIDLTDIFDVKCITKKFVSELIIAKYPISSYNNKIP